MEASNWDMMVDLVNTAFREGRLEEETTWQAVVLLPKGENDYRGIGPRGGDVEGSGGNFKSPAHSLYHLPRLPPRISGGSRHMYRHP